MLNLETDSYYVLLTVNRIRFVIGVAEGDQVGETLDRSRDNYYATERDPADQMFVRFTDLAGSDTRIRCAHVEAFFFCSPESRAADDQINTVMRAADKAKGWNEDD